MNRPPQHVSHPLGCVIDSNHDKLHEIQWQTVQSLSIALPTDEPSGYCAKICTVLTRNDLRCSTTGMNTANLSQGLPSSTLCTCCMAVVWLSIGGGVLWPGRPVRSGGFLSELSVSHSLPESPLGDDKHILCKIKYF